jgi:DNA-binding transcriptional LysR family regulator
VELQESHTDADLGEAVERGELDLAFMQLPVENQSLEAIELLRDPYVLITSADSPLATGKRSLTLRQLAQQPLIGNRSCRASNLVIDQLRTTGIEPKFVFRSDDNGVVQALAGAGVGVAVVPRLAVSPNDETVRVIELDLGIPPRTIGIVWHADRYHSPAAVAFVGTAREVADQAALRLAA